MALRVWINQDDCISSGKCVADNPTAFAFDDDDLAIVLPGAATLGDERLIRAARTCPSGALRLVDDTGQEVDLR